jgi:hypothetical protein
MKRPGIASTSNSAAAAFASVPHQVRKQECAMSGVNDPPRSPGKGIVGIPIDLLRNKERVATVRLQRHILLQTQRQVGLQTPKASARTPQLRLRAPAAMEAGLALTLEMKDRPNATRPPLRSATSSVFYRSNPPAAMYTLPPCSLKILRAKSFDLASRASVISASLSPAVRGSTT